LFPRDAETNTRDECATQKLRPHTMSISRRRWRTPIFAHRDDSIIFFPWRLNFCLSMLNI